MAVDPRQILAGILTVTMFLMLANMIKRDHFDTLFQTNKSGGGPIRDYKEVKSTAILTRNSRSHKGPWMESNPTDLKTCWEVPPSGGWKTTGFVTFSLTNGPEYHVSQIADAVVVARHLGATLVLPDIRGSKPGDKRDFGDIYNVDKFVRSLDGVVKVSQEPPSKISARNIEVVKVPNRVTEDHISKQIDPIFRNKGNIRLVTYFPSVNMRKPEQRGSSDSVACLGMFGTLELELGVREVVDSMIERLRTLSRKSGGKFVAVDLRVEMLEKKGCQRPGSKSCYGPEEIALFLRKIGYDKDTTVYLTQSRWDSSLDALKDFFPRTYTKESIMPMDKKEMYLNSGTSQFEKVIDFYICSESDSFVPAISGLFYANVAGRRIASGKTQILVPANVPGSATAQDFISTYVSRKNHLAYSCFC